MKIIPKLQTAWQPLQVDNTKVQKPMVMQPIKRTLKPGEMLLNLGERQTVVTPKQTYIQQDNRSDKQRKSDQKYAQQKRKQIELDKAQKRTGEVASALLERTMPSYWIEKTTGENLGSIGRLVTDIATPFATTKGLHLLGKGANYVGKGIDYLARMDMARYGYKPTTKYIFTPNMAGMNNFSITQNSKIIHQARGKFNPILESDIPELENMLNSGQFKEMLIPGSSQKVKMYFPSGNKQPIREDELQLLLSKYQPKRELSSQEKELAKQAPELIKELKKKYGIDFSHENWFIGRPQLGSNAPGALTKLDIDIFDSHIPEYVKLAERLQKSGQLYTKNGKWFGKFEGTDDLPVNPEEYIVAHSNAFENNWKWDGKNYLSGMTAEQYNKLLNNGGLGAENWGTTNGGYAGKIAGETVGGRVVGSLVGKNNFEENILSSPLKNPTSSNYFGISKSVNNGVSSKGITNIPIINDGKQSSWKVFGEDVQVKTLRGNNGDFSLKYKSPYKVLIPTILGGTFVGSINNK